MNPRNSPTDSRRHDWEGSEEAALEQLPWLMDFVADVGAHLNEQAPLPEFPTDPYDNAQAKAIYSLLLASHRYPGEFRGLTDAIDRETLLADIATIQHDNHVTLDLESGHQLLLR